MATFDSFKPVVSILCTAYQHAPYIRDTIEGFLAQRTNFPFEIIIHDDASTDGTREVLMYYQNTYPNIIKCILQHENQHGKERGRVAKILYGAARGEFLALCEGDDHWIDEHKLQRQVDALRQDVHAIGCFTDAFNEREHQRQRYMDGYASAPKGVVCQKDIIRGQGIPTCTFLFKHIDLSIFHYYRRLAPVGDAILFTYLTSFGHLIYQPNVTGVRVIHPGGIYSMRGAVHKLRMHLETLPYMNELSGGKYPELIAERRRKALNAAWAEAMEKSNQQLARYVWPLIARDRKAFGWNFTTTLRNWSKAYMPWLDKLFARITGS